MKKMPSLKTLTLAGFASAAALVAAAVACSETEPSDNPVGGGGGAGNDGGAGNNGGVGNKAGAGNDGGTANNGAAANGGAGDEGGAGNDGGAGTGGANSGGARDGGVTNNGGENNMGGGGAGGAPPTYASCDDGPAPDMKLTAVATGLTQPTFVTSAPGDSSSLYVLEKTGAVKRFDPNDGDTAEATELISLNVNSQFEAGLLGMAFHPEFGQDENRRVFLSYVASGPRSIVEEYTLNGDTLTVVPDTRMVDDEQPATNHNGGMIAFGPDGYLWISLGDGGAQNDGDGNAQDLTEPLGSILRVDVDNIDTPPAGNLSGQGQDTRIYHYGFRNPWRFSFDTATNDLYIADVGQNAWEEVTIVAGDRPSSNFGWPALEGSQPCGLCNNNKPPVSDEMLRPQIEYSHDNSRASVTGGYVYRGKKIPGMVGRYMYADYETNQVWVKIYDGEKVCPEAATDDVTDQIHPDNLSISSFGQDADGEMYIVDISASTVYRIDPE